MIVIFLVVVGIPLIYSPLLSHYFFGFGWEITSALFLIALIFIVISHHLDQPFYGIKQVSIVWSIFYPIWIFSFVALAETYGAQSVSESWLTIVHMGSVALFIHLWEIIYFRRRKRKSAERRHSQALEVERTRIEHHPAEDAALSSRKAKLQSLANDPNASPDERIAALNKLKDR